MPNPNVLLSPLATQEAVLSSKIEGTVTTITEVLAFEAEERQPGIERAGDAACRMLVELHRPLHPLVPFPVSEFRCQSRRLPPTRPLRLREAHRTPASDRPSCDVQSLRSPLAPTRVWTHRPCLDPQGPSRGPRQDLLVQETGQAPWQGLLDPARMGTGLLPGPSNSHGVQAGDLVA